MTAFARSSATFAAGAVTIELRSVNHRYLECHFRIPDETRRLEPRFREMLGDRLRRGKVDCLLRLERRQSERIPTPDACALARLARALEAVGTALPDSRPPDRLSVLMHPTVAGAGDSLDEDALEEVCLSTFRACLEQLELGRQREGAKLAHFVGERLQAADEQVLGLRTALPALREAQRERLQRRLAEMAVDADPGRLEQELALLAQKSDVDEELDRLVAHSEEVRRILSSGGPCGRRLDFLMQEFNREANTLASKATHISTTQAAVELKVLIEQMREQIQNIE